MNYAYQFTGEAVRHLKWIVVRLNGSVKSYFPIDFKVCFLGN